MQSAETMTRKNREVLFFNVDEKEKEIISSFLLKYKNSIRENLNIIALVNDSEQERLKLRRILNKYGNPFILISNDIRIAELAWRSNACYFINLNLSNWLQHFTKDYLKTNLFSKNSVKLQFKSHTSTDFFYPNEIIFILAEGNYSKIQLSNGKMITVTKQIGQIEKEINKLSCDLERFGKSTIINLSKVQKIKNKIIYFNNGKQITYPKYSKSFIVLKKRLLWNLD